MSIRECALILTRSLGRCIVISSLGVARLGPTQMDPPVSVVLSSLAATLPCAVVPLINAQGAWGLHSVFSVVDFLYFCTHFSTQVLGTQENYVRVLYLPFKLFETLE